MPDVNDLKRQEEEGLERDFCECGTEKFKYQEKYWICSGQPQHRPRTAYKEGEHD